MGLMDRVEAGIGERKLIRRGDLVLVAVSGGGDSIALLHVLHGLSTRGGFRLGVVHVHHGLRGREADADAEWVKMTSWRLGLACVVHGVDVRARAKELGESVEMAARRARHEVFAMESERQGAASVALAHHRGDQAETVLLRMARGAGVEGLSGMAPRQVFQGWVAIRPLLNERSCELRGFLAAHGLGWREDSSNAEREATRNRVRHELLPWLERNLNPAVEATLVRMAEVFREEGGLLEQRTKRLLAGVRSGMRVKAGALLRLPVADQRRVIQGWLFESGVPPGVVGAGGGGATAGLAGGGGGASFDLGEGFRVEVAGGELSVEKVAEMKTFSPVELEGEGRWRIEELGWEVEVESGVGFQRSGGKVGQVPAEVYLSARAVKGKTMRVRSVQAGDRIYPTGMTGSVKLQDLFVNEGIPREERGRIPVLEVGGKVAWVCGYRVDRRFAVEGPDAGSVRCGVFRVREG